MADLDTSFVQKKLNELGDQVTTLNTKAIWLSNAIGDGSSGLVKSLDLIKTTMKDLDPTNFVKTINESITNLDNINDGYTKVNNALEGFVKTISEVTSALTNFSSFAKTQSESGDTKATASDSALSTITEGVTSTVTEAAPTPEVTAEASPIDAATSTTVAPIAAPVASAVLSDAPDIGSVLGEPIKELTATSTVEGNNVAKIAKVVDDIHKTQAKSTNQSKLDDLLNKQKDKKTTEKDYKNAKINVVMDSVAIGKEIANGIKGTLGALLNPIALVTAFIVKFAPYILLAIAFLYGMWQALGDDIKDKIKSWAKLLIPGIIGSFIAFKGVIPALIKGVMMAIKIYTMVTRMREHKAIMALYTKMQIEQSTKHAAEMGNAATERIEDSVEHTANMSNSIFDRFCSFMKMVFSRIAALFDMICSRIITALKAVWEAIKGAFDMACNVTKVAMAAVAIVIIIGIVILLVAGIFVVMALLSSAISSAVGKIITEFMRIGKEIKEMVNSIIDPITDVLNGLMREMRQLFYDVKYGNADSLKSGNNAQSQADKEQKQKQGIITGELTVKDGVTKDDFNSVVTAITNPLNIMVVELGTMIALETAQLMMSNPFGALVAVGTGALGAGIMMNRTTNTAKTTDNSETNINRQENNNSSVNNNSALPPETIKDLSTIAKHLETLMTKLKPSDKWELAKINR